MVFTGIVEERGTVVALDSVADGDAALLTVRGPTVVTDAVHGASIAVNGVCLTVVSTGSDDATFTVDVMGETLRRSTIGSLAPGHQVNLERAVRANDRLGGHIVQGHVDGVGEIVARTPGEAWDVVRIAIDAETARYVVEKGSITVDGVSLTVSLVGPDWFEISLIPTTLELTTLGLVKPGNRVNLETDVIAKYVERLLNGPSAPGDGP